MGELDRLMKADPLADSAESERLELLAVLIQDYEQRTVRIAEAPTQEAAAPSVRNVRVMLLGIAVLILTLWAIDYIADRRHTWVAASSPELCAVANPTEVDRLLCRLPNGLATYNARGEMLRDSAYVVSFAVSGSFRDSTVIHGVITTTGDSVQYIEVEPIAISSRMSVHLEGQGFEITPPASEARVMAVTPHQPATWTWQVTPTHSGDQLLVLIVDAILPLKGGSAPFRRSIPRRVHVRVSVLGHMSDALDVIRKYWVIIAGISTVVGAIILRKRQQRRSDYRRARRS